MDTREFDSLAAAIGRLLQARGAQLAAAESCTGGLLAGAVTSVPGSSAWFERGFVTYSNAAKREMLRVPAQILDAHGAVSEPVARAMALGALAASRATVAVSITGIAGPGGDTPGKPVGTVCFAWARSGEAVPRSETRLFAGDRDEVRRQSVLRALEGVAELLGAS